MKSTEGALIKIIWTEFLDSTNFEYYCNFEFLSDNTLIRKKKGIYATLSAIYYLPLFTSRAWSKKWLQELTKEDSAYFKSEMKKYYKSLSKSDVKMLTLSLNTLNF